MGVPEEKAEKDSGLRVRSTPVFKLKDKNNRFYQFIDFRKQFGFIPEIIIVEKVRGSHDKIMVRAVLTQAERKKEDKVKKEAEDVLKKLAKKTPPKSKKG